MKKLRIAAMFSGGASAVQYQFSNDKNWGRNYDVVCGLSNKQNTKGGVIF